MCGVAVAIDLAGRGRAAPWARDLIRHRGPDGDGVLRDAASNLALEHTRLAIIDPDNPAANQPFSDPTSRWTIVYNGELFNFRRLRAALEARGQRFRTESDTEVALTALALDGEKALESFRGMFAFALWDAERRTLLAARDQIGVKPLYYTVADDVFVAASELRTVLAHPRVHPRLDPANVVEYLSFGFVRGAGTLVEGVSKLEPGHVLRVEDGAVRDVEYWDVLPPPAEAGREAELEELLAHLDSAVAASLVSDVPLSLMLSGGLDSSTIAALATRHVPAADLTAYSVSFGLPTDESAVAARLADDLGMRHREITLTPDSLAAVFDDWVEHIDVPTANPTWIAVSCIAAAVQADGHKVLLSGDGPDELFGGYNRWMTYLRFHDRYWRHCPAPLRRAVGTAARPFAQGLAGDIARRARDDGQLFVGSRPFHDDDLRRCLSPTALEAAREHPPEAGVERLRGRFANRLPSGDQLAWMSYVALKTDLVEDYLVRLDAMGMQRSVEGRVPLLDVGLAEFAFSLPQEMKVGRRYEQKALFRRAAATLLPEYVTKRPKQGFCPPVADWAARLMRSRVDGAAALAELGLTKADAVRSLAARDSVNSSFALWTIGTLNRWCESVL